MYRRTTSYCSEIDLSAFICNAKSFGYEKNVGEFLYKTVSNLFNRIRIRYYHFIYRTTSYNISSSRENRLYTKASQQVHVIHSFFFLRNIMLFVIAYVLCMVYAQH